MLSSSLYLSLFISTFLYLWEIGIELITFHHTTTNFLRSYSWLILKCDTSLESSPQAHLISHWKRRVNWSHFSPPLSALGLRVKYLFSCRLSQSDLVIQTGLAIQSDLVSQSLLARLNKSVKPTKSTSQSKSKSVKLWYLIVISVSQSGNLFLFFSVSRSDCIELVFKEISYLVSNYFQLFLG